MITAFGLLTVVLATSATAASANTFTWQIPQIDTVPATGTTEGCAAFPIAIQEGSRSVTPPGEGVNPYPAASEFTYPLSPPTYQSFTNHKPDVPLVQAEEGTLYKVQNGSGAGNFAWLVWNVGISSGEQTLANSLTWPGYRLCGYALHLYGRSQPPQRQAAYQLYLGIDR